MKQQRILKKTLKAYLKVITTVKDPDEIHTKPYLSVNRLQMPRL
jgi:hypothetical protein